MTEITNRIERGARQWGEKWDPSELLAADPSIVAAYNSGQRVRVLTAYGDGETYERTGIVSTTTGWRPAFILVHRTSDRGSSDIIAPGSRVTAVKRSGRYVAHTFT